MIFGLGVILVGIVGVADHSVDCSQRWVRSVLNRQAEDLLSMSMEVIKNGLAPLFQMGDVGELFTVSE